VGNPQTITLNGKQYDALTGTILGDSGSTRGSNTIKNSVASGSKKIVRPKSIDGFVGGSTIKPFKRPVRPTIATTKDDHKHHSVAPHAKRSVERSKTLMRTAVKRPSSNGEISGAKIKHGPNYRERLSGVIATGVIAAQPAKEALSARAQAIQKSELVTKFGELNKPIQKVAPDPNRIQTTKNSEVHLKNLDALAKQEQAPKTSQQDIFEEAALKLANSYQSIKRRHTPFYEDFAKKLHIGVKTLFISTFILLILIAAGVFSYLYRNNINMFIADKKTGLNASLASYTPPGFGVSSIKYFSNQGSSSISINYNSNSDQRNYLITEQNSTLDSQGLVTSVVQPYAANNYQSTEIGGRTIYLYTNNAVWVSNGIEYRILNNANLTKSQLEQIISSIQ
jgi:hypothetical protein